MLVSGRPGGNVSAHITPNRLGTLNGQLGDANIRHVFTENFKSLYQPNTSNVDVDFANKFETLLNTTAAGPSLLHLLILQPLMTVLAP